MRILGSGGRALSCAPLLLLLLLAPRPGLGQASPAPVPEDVRAFTSAFLEAVRSYDVDGWADLVSEDVVMMAPNGRVVEGREAFRELWARSFAGQSGLNPLTVLVRDVRASEGLAVVRADYGPEGADPVGQYVWVLIPGPDGGWLLDWWIFNRRP